MYQRIVEGIVRGGFDRLNHQDYEAVVSKFAPDINFRFPGDHALGGERHGMSAAREWFQQLFTYFPGIQLTVESVTVTGWPWDTRVFTQFSDDVPFTDGVVFHNRGVQFLRLRWGKVVEDFLYLDTQVVAAALEHAMQETSPFQPVGTQGLHP